MAGGVWYNSTNGDIVLHEEKGKLELTTGIRHPTTITLSIEEAEDLVDALGSWVERMRMRMGGHTCG